MMMIFHCSRNAKNEDLSKYERNMGIINTIMFMLGMNGSNFSRKEKDRILEVIEEYEAHVLRCRRFYDECDNMSKWLHERLGQRIYVKLTALYHRYGFYSKKINITRNGLFFWSTTDFSSRLKAVELLRVALIND